MTQEIRPMGRGRQCLIATVVDASRGAGVTSSLPVALGARPRYQLATRMLWLWPMAFATAGCEALVGAAAVGMAPVLVTGTVGASVNAANPVERVEPELASALIARVPIYATGDPAVTQGEQVGDATALSCERMPGDPPASQEDALVKLRLQAERRGANAVILMNCDQRGNLSFTKNCYSWVECRGSLVRVTSSGEAVRTTGR